MSAVIYQFPVLSKVSSEPATTSLAAKLVRPQATSISTSVRREVSPASRAVPQVSRPAASVWQRRGRGLTRLALLLVLVSAIGYLSLAAAASDGSAGSSSENLGYEYVTVFSGQSLWQIAEEHAPNQDPREFIHQVISLNQLGSADVTAGQRIAIPRQ